MTYRATIWMYYIFIAAPVNKIPQRRIAELEADSVENFKQKIRDKYYDYIIEFGPVSEKSKLTEKSK